MNGQTAAALADLLHADQALITIYDDALSRLSTETASVIESAVDDHRRHEQLLTDALGDAEMQSVEPSEDVQALMREYARQVRTARAEREVLNVLVLAEQFNAMLYDNASRDELPEELDEIITSQHADERLHASLIAERTPQIAMGLDHDLACMTGGLTDDKNPDDFD